MKVYIAGSLFNEAEVAQRKLEGVKIRSRFPKLEVFNPIDQPFNDDKDGNLPTPITIFDGDTKAVRDCDIFICDVTNQDPGVMVELGIAIEMDHKIIIGINSDIRLKSSNLYEIPPYGMNHYVLGSIQKHGYLVYTFDEALVLLEKLLTNKSA